jgi:hypothetical protein
MKWVVQFKTALDITRTRIYPHWCYLSQRNVKDWNLSCIMFVRNYSQVFYITVWCNTKIHNLFLTFEGEYGQTSFLDYLGFMEKSSYVCMKRLPGSYFSPVELRGSRGNGVDIAIRLRAGRRGVWILFGARYFSPIRPDRLWGPYCLLFSGYKSSSSSSSRGVKLNQVKNESGCTCTPPMCPYGVDTERFTFFTRENRLM